MAETSIEWTDRVWNPVRGCSRVSEGCRFCYAERVAARFSGVRVEKESGARFGGDGSAPFEGFAEMTPNGPRWTGKVELIPEKLAEPFSWRKPARIFVNSMSDLFHERLPDEAIDQVFAVMALAHRHTFQILTKRPERMHRYLTDHAAGGRHIWPAAQKIEMPRGEPKPSPGWPLPNVWLGVSVEDQRTADARIPLLLQAPAAVRFVSYEPALGPVNFSALGQKVDPEHAKYNALRGGGYYVGDRVPDDAWRGRRLDWIIVGGESGHEARPFLLSAAREVVRQCKAAGVPVFVKQLGAKPVMHIDEWLAWCDREGWAPEDAETIGRFYVVVPNRSRKGGDPSEWPADLRVREFPGAA